MTAGGVSGQLPQIWKHSLYNDFIDLSENDGSGQRQPSRFSLARNQYIGMK